MSTKIIQAINAMITNKNKIEVVGQTGNILWFMYDGKYKWSISEGSEAYYLNYFAGQEGLKDLMAMWQTGDLNDYEELISYSTDEIKTREAIDSFRALYQVVKEKRFNIDRVLDQIIDDLPF